MRKAYKFRLYPNRSQKRGLDAVLETHRRLYNLALRERRDVYGAEGRTVSYGEQSRRYKETRKVMPRFAALNFSSAQATLRRLDKAFKAFFRRVKASPGDAPGYPRYKPEDRFKTESAVRADDQPSRAIHSRIVPSQRLHRSRGKRLTTSSEKVG